MSKRQVNASAIGQLQTNIQILHKMNKASKSRIRTNSQNLLNDKAATVSLDLQQRIIAPLRTIAGTVGWGHVIAKS
jgi:hypothetical protein